MNFRRDTYWLKNASIPSCLIVDKTMVPQTREGLGWWDLEITGGIITQILPAGKEKIAGKDLQGGIVFPCFTDVHTH